MRVHLIKGQKNNPRNAQASLSVDVDGFEPPTLCL